VKRRLGAAGLRLTRWRVDGSPPDLDRYVAIAAPHTSNWDLPYLLLHAWYHGIAISWLAKASLFRGPLGVLLRRLGGIPVRRGERGGTVETLVREFAARDRLVVVIPPEGTRSAADHWKTGFYEVARAAQVPVVCIYLDYERRTGGFGPTVTVTGDVEADLAPMRDFFGGVRGKYPDQASRIAFQPPTGDGR
jgi:1-acyl-sn-glycerol-3-phosphate acyltransferase